MVRCRRSLFSLGLVLTVLHLLLTLILLEEPRGVEEERKGREEGQEIPECNPEEGNNTDTCVGRVTSIQASLAAAGVTTSCSLLQQNCCSSRHRLATSLSSATSVQDRLQTCDIQWPRKSPITQEEQGMPLGFYLTAYTDPRNLELLLSSIFRPHNSYCLHVDTKASPTFLATVESLLQCYRTRYPSTYIHTADKPVPVYWGHISVVDAELSCLWDLLTVPDWKYAVNLAGSEMVLTTNRELVSSLSSSPPDLVYTASFPPPASDYWRWQSKFQQKTPQLDSSKYDPESRNYIEYSMSRQKEPPQPVPFNLTLYKGAKAHRLPRAWVEWLLWHPVPRAFLAWAATTAVPDELVVPTLARVSSSWKDPGGAWQVEQAAQPRETPHFQLWKWPGNTCHGVWRHSVCTLSLEDLPAILTSGKQVVNKFRSDMDPLAAHCLAEMLRDRDQ